MNAENVLCINSLHGGSDMEHLGTQIKRAREQAGVGMYTLAREIKTSPHTLRKLEKDGWCRHPELLQQISTYLNAQFVIVIQPAASDAIQ